MVILELISIIGLIVCFILLYIGKHMFIEFLFLFRRDIQTLITVIRASRIMQRITYQYIQKQQSTNFTNDKSYNADYCRESIANVSENKPKNNKSKRSYAHKFILLGHIVIIKRLPTKCKQNHEDRGLT